MLEKEGIHMVIPSFRLPVASTRLPKCRLWRFFFLMLLLHIAIASQGAAPNISQQTDILRQCIEAYSKQPAIRGFYDYAPKRPAVLTATFDPTSITIPPNEWPCHVVHGFPAFLAAVKTLDALLDRPDLPADQREEAFVRLLNLLEEYPFLQYQAYYASRDGTYGVGQYARVPNTIFTQFMSRWLLLLAVKAYTRVDPPAVTKTEFFIHCAFPTTPNGQAGAVVFRKLGVLLVGIGVYADTDTRHYTRVNVQQGWKAVKGGTHPSGIYDYAYWTDEMLQVANTLLDYYPAHLLAGASAGNRLTAITVHGYYYINEMDDFARRYHPQDANIRGWLGYLHGQSLNTFGTRTMNLRHQLETMAFRSGDQIATAQSHYLLTTLQHELLHYLHYTVAVRKPEMQQRLTTLIDLGVREQSNILGFIQDIEKFQGGATPAYRWFQQHPQEFVATLAGTCGVDPIATLNCCNVLAIHPDKPCLQPLNHVLWLLDACSLDAAFTPTNRSFLVTMQPDGCQYRCIPVTLARDAQGRITSVEINGATLRLTYDADGIARPR